MWKKMNRTGKQIARLSSATHTCIVHVHYGSSSKSLFSLRRCCFRASAFNRCFLSQKFSSTLAFVYGNIDIAHVFTMRFLALHSFRIRLSFSVRCVVFFCDPFLHCVRFFRWKNINWFPVAPNYALSFVERNEMKEAEEKKTSTPRTKHNDSRNGNYMIFQVFLILFYFFDVMKAPRDMLFLLTCTLHV